MRTPAARFAHTRNAQRAIPNHPASGLANPLRHELETRAKLAEFAFSNRKSPDFGTIILFWRRQKSETPAFRSVNLRRINEKEIRAILDDNFRKAEARAFSLSSPKGGEGRGEEAVF